MNSPLDCRDVIPWESNEELGDILEAALENARAPRPYQLILGPDTYSEWPAQDCSHDPIETAIWEDAFDPY